MASVSYSVTRGTLEQTLAAGSQTVTVGASAPSAGDLSIEIDLTKGWTKREIEEALDVIWRFLDNPNNDNSNPL